MINKFDFSMLLDRLWEVIDSSVQKDDYTDKVRAMRDFLSDELEEEKENDKSRVVENSGERRSDVVAQRNDVDHGH